MLVIEPDGFGSMHEAQKNPDIIKMSGFFVFSEHYGSTVLLAFP